MILPCSSPGSSRFIARVSGAKKTARGRTRTASVKSVAPTTSLSAMLDARNRTAVRDLAEELPWDLSLGVAL